MRKSKQEAAKTRRRIIETASRQFREKGISETGLTELMAGAGLTQGGFYRHFDSKEQLVTEACAYACDLMVADDSATKGIEEFVADYLSPEHRENAANGCLVAALAGDIARAGEETRSAVTERFDKIIDTLAAKYPHERRGAARARAMFVLSSVVGALAIARMLNDEKLAAAVLSNARRQLGQLI